MLEINQTYSICEEPNKFECMYCNIILDEQ